MVEEREPDTKTRPRISPATYRRLLVAAVTILTVAGAGCFVLGTYGEWMQEGVRRLFLLFGAVYVGLAFLAAGGVALLDVTGDFRAYRWWKRSQSTGSDSATGGITREGATPEKPSLTVVFVVLFVSLVFAVPFLAVLLLALVGWDTRIGRLF